MKQLIDRPPYPSGEVWLISTHRRIKAKDVDETKILTLLSVATGWIFTNEFCQHFPGFPVKVIAAKLKRMLERGLVYGCPCGCRGDWEITQMGRETLMHLPKF